VGYDQNKNDALIVCNIADDPAGPDPETPHIFEPFSNQMPGQYPWLIQKGNPVIQENDDPRLHFSQI